MGVTPIMIDGKDGFYKLDPDCIGLILIKKQTMAAHLKIYLVS